MFLKRKSRQDTARILKTLYGSLSWFLLTTLSGVLGGLLVIPQTYLFARLITGIPAHLNDESMMFRVWWLLGGAILMRGACRYIMEWSGGHLSVGVKTAMRRTLLNHLIRFGQTGLHREQVGEWIQTTYTDIENVEPFFRLALPQMIFAVVLPSAVLIVVFWIDWISGLILLVTAPLIPFFMTLLGRLAKSRTTRRWETMRQLGGHFYDIVSGLTTLKWFNRSKAQVSVVAKVGEAYRRATMDTLKLAFLSSFVLELLATLGTAMVAVGVGLRLLTGHLSFTDGLTTIMLAGEFYLPLRSLGGQFHASMEGRVALQHINSILDSPTPGWTVPLDRAIPSVSVNVQTTTSSTFPQTNHPIIRVENVIYTYPEATTPALDSVSVSVYAGERVAIIGPSGAGKSTLFSLLLGFVRPQHGSVYVHAERLSERTIAAWRHDVAYIGQQPHIFSGSVLENLKLARPAAEFNEIQRVAEQTGVAEFVQHLTHGYHTKIGSGGVPLSAGQIQRIALARALLKSCSVWLLDEPTAHLDVESERWFMEVLRHLPPSQTVLIIAHRLSTVERMNKAFLVQNGRVTTVVSPKDLDERKKWYEELGLHSLRSGG
ncbi:thiol reductant ABC exporter subunit CydD [Alicyclobacillus fastidiosus]|uniref:Thiol reductant ABC exporter subunit CydD n=1 Tax=Alicyclobacillus fastidiosus TaxID=392011 RepID=A0ABV5AHW9_9BACL